MVADNLIMDQRKRLVWPAILKKDLDLFEPISVSYVTN